MSHLSATGADPSGSVVEAFAASAADVTPAIPALTVSDVIEALPEAICITDAFGRIIHFNRAATDLWGAAPQPSRPLFCGSAKLYASDGAPLPVEETAIAVALRERQPVRGMETISERPDGSRVPCLEFATPIFNSNGELVGAVNMLVDQTDRIAIETNARRYEAIFESSDDAILAKDLKGTITNWNRGAERLFGYTADEAIGKPVVMLIPLDRQNAGPEILRRIALGERIDHYETIRRRKDGSLVEISLTVSPIRNRAGRVVGASKVARDITERRRAEEQQSLLIREMDHRIKNLFSLANSLVLLSSRSAETVDALASDVSARLSALASAHSLTVAAVGDGSAAREQVASLQALIGKILTPYESAQYGFGGRAKITGDDPAVGGIALTSFAMVLHEFATNAAKYGALSVPDGRLDISCLLTDDRLTLTWTEICGPGVLGEPASESFGTRLVSASIRGYLGGEITRDWRVEGLVIMLSVPRSRLIA